MTLHLPRGLLAARASLTRADYQLREARLIRAFGRGRDRRYTLGPAALITPQTASPNDPVNVPTGTRGSVPFQDTFPVNIEPLSIPRPRP